MDKENTNQCEKSFNKFL